MTFIPKTTGYTGRELPSAHITKTKRRLKQYNDVVYLEDGDEFEIELFNPHTYSVMATININGHELSKSGIIVRPGERIFLDRYIDVPQKFRFGTYVINGDDVEAYNAIKQNGNIEIKFYTEIISNSIEYINLPSWTIYNPYIYGRYTGDPTLTTNTNVDYTYTSNTTTTFLCDTSLSMETGRVEKGSTSDQKLIDDNTTQFSSYSSHTVKWKILPISTKPIERADIKLYCHSCGAKIKKSTYKFCPHCGTKID